MLNKMEKRIALRISAADYKDYALFAELMDITVSDFFRIAVDEYFNKNKLEFACLLSKRDHLENSKLK